MFCFLTRWAFSHKAPTFRTFPSQWIDSNKALFKWDSICKWSAPHKALFKFISQNNCKLLHGMNCHRVGERPLGPELRLWLQWKEEELDSKERILWVLLLLKVCILHVYPILCHPLVWRFFYYYHPAWAAVYGVIDTK